MKNIIASISSPGRLTLLAALLAGPAFAAPGDVVISQVYGAGGNSGAAWNRDFIELFNRSSNPVSLSGMSVQYQSATGTSWQATALPAVTLQPGQYFLVTGAGGSVGADVGVADQTGNLNLSATAGKVALSNIATAMTTADGGANLIDLVGFGSANRYETAASPAPSNQNSIQRAALGCTDTDNNALDFSAGLVTGPRRSTSPLHSCSVPVQPIVANCPADMLVPLGSASAAQLTASDADSIVNSASIVTGAVPGISLAGFAPAGAAGASASVNLQAAPSLVAGNYPVEILFGNNNGQEARCTVTVRVAGELTIPQIQGTGPVSSYNNTVQTTRGVITAKVGNGFFIQDINGDGDPTTSDALFVYGASTGGVVGDLVRVSGTVTEYTPSGANRSYTELKDVTAVIKLSGGHSIAPTNIALPNADLARYEGMLVRFTGPLTVNGNKYLGTRGELTLSYGRREVPTNRYPAGSAEAVALAAANAANEIVLDDGIFTVPDQIPYLGADGTVRSGDVVSDLTGVLDFGSVGGGGAAFKVQPTETPVFSRTNERIAAPVLAPGNVKVASANVLNFFTTFTNGTDAWGRTGQGCTLGSQTSASNCRGADSLPEFMRQRDKIVAELAAVDADVVGLMEIQNNDDIAVSYLVDQLNAVTGPGTYAVVPKPAATGTDAIRVAMIYKPAALTLVGGALSDGDALNNRAPMAQTFRLANGARFSLVVNHLRAKSSCGSAGPGNTDVGDFQGCWNATRVQQAQRLVNYFIPQVVSAANDPDVLVIGDLNSYGFEDPINVLTASGLVSQIERFVRPQGTPYSFIFGGLSGYIDHALASASLDPQVVGVTEWHNNADEPEALDYNMGDTSQDPYVNDGFRASDHDPVVISLNLAPTFTDVTASVNVVQSGLTMNRFTSKYSGTVSFQNTTGADITGPLRFVLQGLPAGVTLDGGSIDENGRPYITLRNASIPVGATVSVSTTFTNPSKVSIVYMPKLFSSAF